MWKLISKDELVKRKILNENESFESWVYNMIDKGILICRESKEDIIKHNKNYSWFISGKKYKNI